MIQQWRKLWHTRLLERPTWKWSDMDADKPLDASFGVCFGSRNHTSLSTSSTRWNDWSAGDVLLQLRLLEIGVLKLGSSRSSRQYKQSCTSRSLPVLTPSPPRNPCPPPSHPGPKPPASWNGGNWVIPCRHSARSRPRRCQSTEHSIHTLWSKHVRLLCGSFSVKLSRTWSHKRSGSQLSSRRWPCLD